MLAVRSPAHHDTVTVQQEQTQCTHERGRGTLESAAMHECSVGAAAAWVADMARLQGPSVPVTSPALPRHHQQHTRTLYPQRETSHDGHLLQPPGGCLPGAAPPCPPCIGGERHCCRLAGPHSAAADCQTPPSRAPIMSPSSPRPLQAVRPPSRLLIAASAPRDDEEALASSAPPPAAPAPASPLPRLAVPDSIKVRLGMAPGRPPGLRDVCSSQLCAASPTPPSGC